MLLIKQLLKTHVLIAKFPLVSEYKFNKGETFISVRFFRDIDFSLFYDQVGMMKQLGLSP